MKDGAAGRTGWSAAGPVLTGTWGRRLDVGGHQLGGDGLGTVGLREEMAGEEGTHRRWICPERTRGKGFTRAGERIWGERERPQGSNVRGGPRRRGTGQARGVEKGAEHE